MAPSLAGPARPDIDHHNAIHRAILYFPDANTSPTPFMALDNGFEGNQMTDEQVAAISAKGPPPAPDYTNPA